MNPSRPQACNPRSPQPPAIPQAREILGEDKWLLKIRWGRRSWQSRRQEMLAGDIDETQQLVALVHMKPLNSWSKREIHEHHFHTLSTPATPHWSEVFFCGAFSYYPGSPSFPKVPSPRSPSPIAPKSSSASSSRIGRRASPTPLHRPAVRSRVVRVPGVRPRHQRRRWDIFTPTQLVP